MGELTTLGGWGWGDLRWAAPRADSQIPYCEAASLRALTFTIGVSGGKRQAWCQSPKASAWGGEGRCLENQQHQTAQSTHFSRSATHIFQNKKLRHREERELVQSCMVSATTLGKPFEYPGPYCCLYVWAKPFFLTFLHSSHIPASVLLKGSTAARVILGVSRNATTDAHVWSSGWSSRSQQRQWVCI